MQNLQNKYFSIFLKNMLKYDEDPDGILDPARVFVIFSKFLKKCKIRGPSTYFVKICRPSTYFAYFRVKTYEPLSHGGLVKDFEKAWPLPWYHDGLPKAPLCA